jgi:hypothetical protein
MIKKFIGSWMVPDNSENNNFFKFCREASESEIYFSSFKTNPNFTPIIGNDVRGYDIAKSSLKKITDYSLLDNIEKYKENDLLGSPPLHFFPTIGKISSGTLYFMFILNNILEEFGDITNFDVCEIGSGYGGQANILLTYGVNQYTCIDNFSTLSLAKKYLTKNNKTNVIYYDTDNIETDRNYDLVISNWCLSEMDQTGISFYIDNIVSKSRFGYFEMNMWDQDRKNFLLNEMKKHFKTVKVVDEIIKTHSNNNFLLICKKD